MMSLYLGSKWSVDAWMIRALRSASNLHHRFDGDPDRDEDAEQATDQ